MVLTFLQNPKVERAVMLPPPEGKGGRKLRKLSCSVWRKHYGLKDW